MKNRDFDLISSYVDTLSIPSELKKTIAFETFSKKNPDYYMRYPRLFRDVFEKQDDEQIDFLCIAGFLYYRSMIFMDGLLDGKIKQGDDHAALIPIAISICQEESIKLLTHIFGLRSNFWNYWNLRRKEYLQAFQMEKMLSKDSRHFSIDFYENIAEKKAAMGKVAIDALHVLDREKNVETYQALLAGHEMFSIGLQLSDDFQDFEEDTATGQFNWTVYYTQKELEREGRPSGQFDTHALKKMMYVKGVANGTLTTALQYFQKAERHINILSAPSEFSEILKDRTKEAENVIEQIKAYFSILNTRLELARVLKHNYIPFLLLPDEDNRFNTLVNQSFSSLVNEANTDFSELKHVMYLGKNENFDNQTEIHVGDIFQRAILLDILCDLQEKTPQGNLLLPMINAEVAYLYASKLSRGVGGWSYFPTVKEIAPDADDLGQVLQCFARVNRKDIIEEHCISLLETLFTDNYLENCGAFETWIIPRGNRSELEELQNYFNTTKWGKGPDPEVVANLLFGTVTAGLNQYAELVSNGIKYLLEEQAPQGFWKSRWYYGSYYGTYICLRLFQATKTASSAAGKALDWLLNTQNEDGGWGNTPGISTPLCTAFALLCFSTHPETMHAPIVAKGTEYLIRSGLEYGGIYPAEPFIIPKEGQPYKSKTITTAYVLKALISTMKITN